MQSRDVLFPQRCELLSCAFGTNGDFRAVMTSADRLLVLREGTLCVSGSLVGEAESEHAKKEQKIVTKTAAARQIRFCHFTDDIRVAVVAADGVTIVDVSERDVRLRCRRVCVDIRSCGSMLKRCESASSSLATSPNGESKPLWLSRLSALASHNRVVREAVDADFVSVSSLVIVFTDEAVVVELDPHCDIVKWRIWGSYCTLAVCRTNMHLAFALDSSIVEVFPLKLKQNQKDVARMFSAQVEGLSSHVFFPTQEEALVTKNLSGENSGFALRGVSTNLGPCKILAIEWHLISSYALLCVTCQHSENQEVSVVFFTLQPVLESRFLLSRKDREDDTVGLRQRQAANHSLQLILAGTVSFHSLFFSPLTTRIVPMFSRSSDTVFLRKKIEFFSIDRDGTVRITTYRFSQQSQGGFLKQSATSPKYPKLFLSLQETYGDIVRVDVLPIWRSRVVEFGAFTPQAEQLVGARRYRLLVHFANGMIAKVMIDLLVAVVRVEAFLTLGVDQLPLRLSACRGTNGEVFLLGISRERAFLIEQVTKDRGVAETTVLAVSPASLEHLQRLQGSQMCVATTTSSDEVAECKKGQDAEAVRRFVEAKCSEKLRLVPSLMKTCGGDTRKLLTQLKAKCGPLEVIPVLDEKVQESSDCALEDSTSSSDVRVGPLYSSSFVHSASSAFPWMREGLTVQQVHLTSEGFCFSTRVSANNAKKEWWCIPAAAPEGFAAAQGELLVFSARLPSTAPLKRLNAAPSEQHCYSNDNEVLFEWVESTKSVIVRGTLLPDDPPLSFSLLEFPLPYRVAQIQAIRLLNNDIIVGVMCTLGDVEPKTVLLLYGLDLLRDILGPPAFLLELEIYDVLSFVLCNNDTALVLRRQQTYIERWSRVINGDNGGYCWEGSPLHDVVSGQGEIIAMAPLWMESCGRSNEEMQLDQLFFSFSDGGFIHVWNNVSSQHKAFARAGHRDSGDGVCVELYHPTAILLLLDLWRSQVVVVLLERLFKLTSGRAVWNVSLSADAEACLLVSELCHNPVNIQFCSQPSLLQKELDAANICAVPLDMDTQLECLLQEEKGGDGNVLFSDYLSLELLEQAMEQLPTMRLQGLSSQEQLALLCVVEAMRATKLFSVSLDAAASRFFFIHKLCYFQQRLSMPAKSVDNFSRPYTAFLWATISDAQPQLLDVLFGKQADRSFVSWEDVESAGVPLWVHSLQTLRTLAERVARGRYQATKDLRECALMYILAGKVGVLATLCKMGQNLKLHAFFSRDFGEPKNKAAASSNAFAAVSKNMVEYGSAFFVLAKEPRSAAQVILQRSGSVALALFVLRLAGGDDQDDLLWFMEQRRREEAQYGPMDLWEEACLLWRCGETQKALLLLSHHVPRDVVDAAETLSFLRYERQRVRGEVLTLPRELLLLLRMTRLLLAAGMWSLAMMCSREAKELLVQARRTQEAKRSEPVMGTAQRGIAACTEANFDAGTLTFFGLNLDDDDYIVPENDISIRDDKESTLVVLPTSTMMDSENVVDESINALSVTALEMMLQWTQQRFEVVVPAVTLATHRDGDRNNIRVVLACTARLIVDVGRHMPLLHVEDRLVYLLKTLPSSRDQSVDALEEQNLQLLLEVASRLVIIAVRFVLISVAIQNTDYALASALLEFSTVAEVLRGQKSEMATLNSVVSYVYAVRSVQSRVRAMTVEQLEQNEMEESESFSPVCCEENVLPPAEAYEERLRVFLISWCAAFLQLCTLDELQEEILHLRCALAGLLHPPQYAQLLLWLLGSMLCRVTLAFNATAAELISLVVSVRELDGSLLTNPNGIFIEEEQELRRMAELLENNLLAGANGAELLQPLQTVLLDLCVSRAELFWKIPHVKLKISAETDEVVLLLQKATLPHAAAYCSYVQLSNSAMNTLRRVEAAWLRRHHTHASYREFLLEWGLRGSLTQLTTTDRLVLHQASHAVCSLDYDHFSCDSLVWSTHAGAEVSHGYREVLAGDNEAALMVEHQDRNVATAVFSKSLYRDGDMKATEEIATKRHAALSGRPRFSLATHAMVASHPHLPYFLTPHGNGYVDLYSFTSTECLATFLCHNSHVVTNIAYSPNGYVFAAGLADGSVSVWRFDLNASASNPFFVQRLLPPGGVKLTCFCGNQKSLLVVAGFDYVKEESSAIVGTRGGEKKLFRTKRSEHCNRQVVGVLLIVDLVQQGGGKVVMRRELPFVPDYVVYIAKVDLVLCITTDGLVVVFDVWRSSMYILGASPPTSPCVAVSCVAVSRYDDIVAIGTGNGHTLLLLLSTILDAKAACVRETICDLVAPTYVAEENILYRASRLQLAPVLTSHSGVCCMVFTPSVLLAGLGDGKLVAATLVPNALRQGSPLS